jgi:hypothetical protein
MSEQSADGPYTEATYAVEEFRILVDLTAARLFDLGRDLAALQEQMVRCYALLATLAPAPELSSEDPPAVDIWGFPTS